MLQIPEIFPEDAGTYTCEAFNDVGECFSSCTLVVNVPSDEEALKGHPSFTSFPRSHTAERNAVASFTAEVTGEVKEVAWFKDGKQMYESPMKNKITMGSGKSGRKVLSLDVMECGSTDSGQYAVIVSGDTGEAKAAFSLNVT